MGPQRVGHNWAIELNWRIFIFTTIFVVVQSSVVSNSLQLLGLKHTMRPCPSLSPRVCSNWCPLSQWCHPTTSSSVARSSSCTHSFPASGTLNSLHQHQSSKAVILRDSASFMVQLSCPYMTTGKTIALTLRTFISKRMSLLFKYTVKFCHSFSSEEQASFN